MTDRSGTAPSDQEEVVANRNEPNKAAADGMEYVFGPKAQRWNQQGHSAPKMRKQKYVIFNLK